MVVPSIFSFLAWLFWEKTQGIATAFASSLSRCCGAKTVTFCNISVITEDVYLKLGVCVHYPKSNPYYQRDNSEYIFLCQN